MEIRAASASGECGALRVEEILPGGRRERLRRRK